MTNFQVTTISSGIDPLERSRILAKVYTFLLSLPDPGNNIEHAADDLSADAAGSVNVSRNITDIPSVRSTDLDGTVNSFNINLEED